MEIAEMVATISKQKAEERKKLDEFNYRKLKELVQFLAQHTSRGGSHMSQSIRPRRTCCVRSRSRTRGRAPVPSPTLSPAFLSSVVWSSTSGRPPELSCQNAATRSPRAR